MDSSTHFACIAVVATALLTLYVHHKALWWYPKQKTTFVNLDMINRAAPAEPNQPEFMTLVQRNELLDWYHAGALHLQSYENLKVAKSFDTVLGPLYCTDRHTFQVLESFTREVPLYANRVSRFALQNGIENLESCTAHFEISHYIDGVLTPLFSYGLFIGLGATFNLLGQALTLNQRPDIGLTFYHRPPFDTKLFNEVRRGGFSWRILNFTYKDSSPY